jgi:plasmid stabilization system protein ParE
MQLRWTAAADDLEGIAEYLFEKSPQNAAQLIRKIYEAPDILKSYPNLGRPGKKVRNARIGDCALAIHCRLSN